MIDKETVCGDNSGNVSFGASMNNPSTEYFSEEASLPDLRSPFGAIDASHDLNFGQTVSPSNSRSTTTLPADELQNLDSFRQETTNKAVQALVDQETVAEPKQIPAPEEDDDQLVSRTQLCRLFEQFLGQLKGVPPGVVVKNEVAEVQDAPIKISPISVSDRTEEIDQLKSLLIEAQETIIKLLTDRVDDRAKIAALETEVRLLPGPRLTADEQARLVVEHDDLKKELAKVKLEFEQLGRVHANFKLKHKRPPLWLRVWRLLIKDTHA
jgi:hypothetical protein